MDETWTAVDRLYDDLLHLDDDALLEAVAAGRAAGLPEIQVAPNQGKLLHLLARAVGARRILEVGTLAGYSTIWLARALPEDGRLITLEVNPRHAEVARENLQRAGVAHLVEVRVGAAIDAMRALRSEQAGAFDLVFIDADKPTTADYFTLSVDMTRPGGLVVVDNVVRKGEILEAWSDDVNVQGMRHFNEVLAAERRVSATVVQTVGVKGYDGFALALVTGG